jgi:hypothetical protein
MKNMAILFWFYKEPEICKNRLEILRKYNPDMKIYGLFGGQQGKVKIFKKYLGKYLDDFYVSPPKDSRWKWINGDLMILDWYKKRGKKLVWDSIAVVQWDALVFVSLKKYFRNIKKGQVFLSGLKLLEKTTENRWHWTRSDRKERKNYLNFLDYVRKNYNYSGKPLCCLFIFQIFPRIFFEKYLTVKNRAVGMLEYKIPIYAKIFNIPFFRKDVGILWFQKVPKPLNAMAVEIGKKYIGAELKKKNGWRIFHPYFKEWK